MIRVPDDRVSVQTWLQRRRPPGLRMGPTGIETAQQIELTRRLLSSVTCSLRDKLQLETKADQLRSTEEMLALRRVVDRDYETPAQMLEEFFGRIDTRLNDTRKRESFTKLRLRDLGRRRTQER